MDYPKVAIIILNWNGMRFLEDCLDSIFEQTYQNYGIILVDNASTDESVNFIRWRYSPKIDDKKLKIIVNNENYGFAKGNNIGILSVLKDKEVKFIVTLNNDVIVERDWLSELVIKAQEGYEIVNSKSYFLNGNVESIGGYLCVDGLAYLRRSEELPIGGGVSILYAREIFEDIGFFDEDYFCYIEETDLSIRAILKNHRKIGIADKSIIWHYGSASSNSLFKIYYMHRNNLWTILKNFPNRYLFKNIFWIITAQLLSILLYIMKGQGKVILMAKIDAIRDIGKILRKRSFIQEKKRISSSEFCLYLNGWFITLRTWLAMAEEK